MTALARAIERRARALGLWQVPAAAHAEVTRLGWHVAMFDDGVSMWHRFGPKADYYTGGDIDTVTHALDELTAATVLLMWGRALSAWGDCANCGGDGVCWELCPLCTVDGTPTGRETRELQRVMLDAARELPDCPERAIVCGTCDRGISDPPPRGSHCDCDVVRVAREQLALFAHTLDPDDAAAIGDWLLDDPGRSLLDWPATPQDPLGAVLALWLAGELSEAHVLGVERCHRQHIAEGWSKRPEAEGTAELHDWAESEGWETLDGWSFHRPTLEARP